MSDTPLHDAAESGDLDKARELLETDKYYFNITRDYRSETPLHSDCRGGTLRHSQDANIRVQSKHEHW